MTKIKQVFISHDSADAQFAHRLAEDLRRLGVQVWIASESIRPGEDWVDAIEHGLRESSPMLVALLPMDEAAVSNERTGIRKSIGVGSGRSHFHLLRP